MLVHNITFGTVSLPSCWRIACTIVPTSCSTVIIEIYLWFGAVQNYHYTCCLFVPLDVTGNGKVILLRDIRKSWFFVLPGNVLTEHHYLQYLKHVFSTFYNYFIIQMSSTGLVRYCSVKCREQLVLRDWQVLPSASMEFLFRDVWAGD